MIDNISDKLTCWLITKNILKDEDYSDFDYYIREFLFCFSILSSLFIVNYILDTFAELLVIVIVFNILRLFCGGFHTERKYCIIITIILFSIFSFLSKLTVIYTLFIFVIAILIGIYIIIFIIKNPPEQEDDEPIREVNYYIFKYIDCLILVYIIGFVCLFLGIDCVTNSISYSIFLIYLLHKLDEFLYKKNIQNKIL